LRDFICTINLVSINLVSIEHAFLSVFETDNLPRGVPEVDECGLAEIGNS
jgi:hypothetical protein